jgi:hypothetical protein
VYRATLHRDVVAVTAELNRLWTDNLPVTDAEGKLRWAYLDSPSGPGEVLLLRDGDAREIGCAGVSTRELCIAGTPLRAALLADFAVDKAHRVGFPALVLQRAVKRHVEAGYHLSYGFPNAHAVAIHTRTGYHQLGMMARYVRVLRHGPYIERRYGHAVAARLAGAAIDTGSRVLQRARARRPSRALALDWLSDVDDRFDRLWRDHAGWVGVACRRDAAFLRWRFVRKFDERVAIAASVDKLSGELRGYAVVHGAANELAELRDLFAADLDQLGSLLAMLLPELYQRGHTAVSIRFLGNPRIPELLAAHDFQLRDADRAVIVSVAPGCPVDKAVLEAAASWYITDLDEDT